MIQEEDQFQKGKNLTKNALIELLKLYKVPLKSLRERKSYYEELYNKIIEENYKKIKSQPDISQITAELNTTGDTSSLVSRKRNRAELDNQEVNPYTNKILINGDTIKNQYNIIKHQKLKIPSLKKEEEKEKDTGKKVKTNKFLKEIIDNADSNKKHRKKSQSQSRSKSRSKDAASDYAVSDEQFINKRKLGKLHQGRNRNKKGKGKGNEQGEGLGLKFYKEVLNEFLGNKEEEEDEGDVREVPQIPQKREVSETPDFESYSRFKITKIQQIDDTSHIRNFSFGKPNYSINISEKHKEGNSEDDGQMPNKKFSFSKIPTQDDANKEEEEVNQDNIISQIVISTDKDIDNDIDNDIKGIQAEENQFVKQKEEIEQKDEIVIEPLTTSKIYMPQDQFNQLNSVNQQNQNNSNTIDDRFNTNSVFVNYNKGGSHSLGSLINKDNIIKVNSSEYIFTDKQNNNTSVTPNQINQTNKPDQTNHLTSNISNTNIEGNHTDERKVLRKKSISDINIIQISNIDNNALDNDNKSVDRVFLHLKSPAHRNLKDPRLIQLVNNLNQTNQTTHSTLSRALSCNNISSFNQEFRRRTLTRKIKDIRIPDPPMVKRLQDVFKNLLERIKRNEDNIIYLLKYLTAGLGTTAVILAIQKYMETNNLNDFYSIMQNSCTELGEFFKNNIEAILLSVILIIAFLAFLDLLIEPSFPYYLNEDGERKNQQQEEVLIEEEVILNYYNYLKNELKNNFSLVGLSHDELLSLIRDNGVTSDLAQIILNKVRAEFCFDEEIKYYEVERVWKFIGEFD